MVSSKNTQTVILIARDGTAETIQSSALTDSVLHKRCGLKSNEGFAKQTVWNVPDDISQTMARAELWAKTIGRSGHENKYDFPPPVDSTLFFGKCLIVARNSDDTVHSIDTDQWTALYSHLFGGFEDLDATAEADELEVDELTDIQAEMKTKDGYLKDDFVVDSDDDPYESDGELGYEAYE